MCVSFLLYPALSATLTVVCHRWEFVTTLDFEWEVFTGKRPWKWSFAVYLTARILALTSVILNFIGFNLTTQFNCNVSIDFSWRTRGSPCTVVVPLCTRFFVVFGRHRLILTCAPWVCDLTFL